MSSATFLAGISLGVARLCAILLPYILKYNAASCLPKNCGDSSYGRKALKINLRRDYFQGVVSTNEFDEEP